MVLRFLPVFAVAVSFAAVATEEDRSQAMLRARGMRDEAATMRAEADRRHALAQTDCWHKVLVSACLDEAARARRADTDKARGLEREAREIERQAKKQELVERDARRQEEAPEREAAAAARAEKNRLETEEAQRRVERRQTEAAQPAR